MDDGKVLGFRLVSQPNHTWSSIWSMKHANISRRSCKYVMKSRSHSKLWWAVEMIIASILQLSRRKWCFWYNMHLHNGYFGRIALFYSFIHLFIRSSVQRVKFVHALVLITWWYVNSLHFYRSANRPSAHRLPVFLSTCSCLFLLFGIGSITWNFRHNKTSWKIINGTRNQSNIRTLI